jgi:hypothetical protein
LSKLKKNLELQPRCATIRDLPRFFYQGERVWEKPKGSELLLFRLEQEKAVGIFLSALQCS